MPALFFTSYYGMVAQDVASPPLLAFTTSRLDVPKDAVGASVDPGQNASSSDLVVGAVWLSSRAGCARASRCGNDDLSTIRPGVHPLPPFAA